MFTESILFNIGSNLFIVNLSKPTIIGIIDDIINAIFVPSIFFSSVTVFLTII